jgi:hypothetical protein
MLKQSTHERDCADILPSTAITIIQLNIKCPVWLPVEFEARQRKIGDFDSREAVCFYAHRLLASVSRNRLQQLWRGLHALS